MDAKAMPLQKSKRWMTEYWHYDGDLLLRSVLLKCRSVASFCNHSSWNINSIVLIQRNANSFREIKSETIQLMMFCPLKCIKYHLNFRHFNWSRAWGFACQPTICCATTWIYCNLYRIRLNMHLHTGFVYLLLCAHITENEKRKIKFPFY